MHLHTTTQPCSYGAGRRRPPVTRAHIKSFRCSRGPLNECLNESVFLQHPPLVLQPATPPSFYPATAKPLINTITSRIIFRLFRFYSNLRLLLHASPQKNFLEPGTRPTMEFSPTDHWLEFIKQVRIPPAVGKKIQRRPGASVVKNQRLIFWRCPELNAFWTGYFTNIFTVLGMNLLACPSITRFIIPDASLCLNSIQNDVEAYTSF